MVASPTTRAQAWSAPELLVLGVRSCCCKPGLRHSLRRGGGGEGKLAGYPVWKRAERVLHSKYTVNVSAQAGRGEAFSGEQRTLGKRTQRGIRFRRFLTDVRSTAKKTQRGSNECAAIHASVYAQLLGTRSWHLLVAPRVSSFHNGNEQPLHGCRERLHAKTEEKGTLQNTRKRYHTHNVHRGTTGRTKLLAIRKYGNRYG